MLRQLGHGIRLRRGVLELPTSFDADLELDERLLQIQAVALSRRGTLAEPADDHLTIRIPAGSAHEPSQTRKRCSDPYWVPGERQRWSASSRPAESPGGNWHHGSACRTRRQAGTLRCSGVQT
ncbi:hypothetical protein [Streptomyces sp. NPDC059161]|uniref:hypothetical protein n=1 Tax=unclassified Streptomyces TaxID=2593676 RepID=UPI00364A5E4B